MHQYTEGAKVKKVATCWPRHILGPALKGTNMKGFGIRYLFNLSSMNRSGSNSSARNRLRTMECEEAWQERTIGTPQICSAVHRKNAIHTSTNIICWAVFDFSKYEALPNVGWNVVCFLSRRSGRKYCCFICCSELSENWHPGVKPGKDDAYRVSTGL